MPQTAAVAAPDRPWRGGTVGFCDSAALTGADDGRRWLKARRMVGGTWAATAASTGTLTSRPGAGAAAGFA